jgi:hypothetical protein
MASSKRYNSGVLFNTKKGLQTNETHINRAFEKNYGKTGYKSSLSLHYAGVCPVRWRIFLSAGTCSIV